MDALIQLLGQRHRSLAAFATRIGGRSSGVTRSGEGANLVVSPIERLCLGLYVRPQGPCRLRGRPVHIVENLLIFRARLIASFDLTLHFFGCPRQNHILLRAHDHQGVAVELVHLVEADDSPFNHLIHGVLGDAQAEDAVSGDSRQSENEKAEGYG